MIMELIKNDAKASPSDNPMHEEWDATMRFICDYQPDGTIKGCIEHMHKVHRFFIPDVKFLKDIEGMLTSYLESYLGLKVSFATSMY